MDKKVYEKTRYQNIYRHKKNKNYVIMMSKPVKTSIATIDGKKIMKIEDALKIRDNPKIKVQKGLEVAYKDDFDTMWNKYIYECQNLKRLSFNTIKKKKILYQKYIVNNKALNIRLSRIKKDDIICFINNLNTSYKQKNEILKLLKSFFNWCLSNDYLITSPTVNIKNFKESKVEMKFWIPDELAQILKTINEDIKSDDFKTVKKARLIKIFILIQFSLGDRVGETRALTFDCFNEKKNVVSIKHSINYDTKSHEFLANTKNYHSQREIDISKKIIYEVKDYKDFLINQCDIQVKNEDLIFFNYATNKPYSDSLLRKHFYYYCEKANVTKIRMYDLRHTYVATMMSEGKELYHISKRIGHSSYSTTVNKYGHLSNKTRKEIAEITDKYI